MRASMARSTSWKNFGTKFARIEIGTTSLCSPRTRLSCLSVHQVVRVAFVVSHVRAHRKTGKRKPKGKVAKPASTAKPKSSAKPTVVQDSEEEERVISTRSRSSAKPTSKKQEKPPSRAVRKRKHDEVEIPADEPAIGNGASDSDVQSIIVETTSAARGRPRRRIEPVKEPVSAPTSRRGRKPNKQKVKEDSDYEVDVDAPDDDEEDVLVIEDDDEEEEAATQPRKSIRQKRPSQAVLAAAESSHRAPRARKSAASSKAPQSAPSTPKRKRGRPRKVVTPPPPPTKSQPIETDEEADAQGETDLDAEADAEGEAMQVDTGAEADVEDEAPMEIEHGGPLTAQASAEVPSSDVLEQEPILTTSETQVELADARAREMSPEIPFLSGAESSQVAESQPEPEPEPATPPPKVPVHRARATQLKAKVLDNASKDDGPGNASKTRVRKRRVPQGEAGPSSSAAAPSTTKGKATNGASKRTKPGPGRSSAGFQLGSAEVLTVVKKTAVGALRRVGVIGGDSGTDGESHAVEAPVPPSVSDEQVSQVATLNVEPVSLPDPEVVGDIAAALAVAVVPAPDGVLEAQVEQGTSSLDLKCVLQYFFPPPLLIPISCSIPLIDSAAPLVLPPALTTTVDPLPATVAPSETLLSPSGNIAFKPDQAIGSSGSNGDAVVWKQTTIFGPL